MRNETQNTTIVKNKDTNKLEVICLDTGEVVNAGIDMSKYRYSQEVAMLICQRIREGMTLVAIDKDPDLPSLPVIHYWRRTNASFDEEIKMARKDRAEYYHDKVIEIAEDTFDKDEVPVNKFKADQYKWAAEKGDPASYGNKIEHTGNNTAPAIIVVTGITRKEPEAIEVESEEIVDDNQTESDRPE